MSKYRELLIGCGHSRVKRINPFDGGTANPGTPKDWQNLVTLDNNSACNPNILCDLSRLDWMGNFVIDRLNGDEGWAATFSMGDEADPQLRGDYFDEIHAYEVLEHIGAQGDFRLFFGQFREFFRILKPRGYLVATVPDYRSVWAWGDPGHTRIINMGTLVFLSQKQYADQLGKTAMSDYRELLSPADFEIVRAKVIGEQLEFVLRAIK